MQRPVAAVAVTGTIGDMTTDPDPLVCASTDLVASGTHGRTTTWECGCAYNRASDRYRLCSFHGGFASGIEAARQMVLDAFEPDEADDTNDTAVITVPARKFGKPVFAASGACVSSVLGRLAAGEALASVADDFELTPDEVDYCAEEFTGGILRLAAAAARVRAEGRIELPSEVLAGTGGAGRDLMAVDDLVTHLRAWSPSNCWGCGEWGCTNSAGHDTHCIAACDCDRMCPVCGSDPVCVCDCHLNHADDAANEIERLRAQINVAHAILGSEPMIWLGCGSNHPEAQLGALKPALDAYWRKYGNSFRPPQPGGEDS